LSGWQFAQRVKVKTLIALLIKADHCTWRSLLKKSFMMRDQNICSTVIYDLQSERRKRRPGGQTSEITMQGLERLSGAFFNMVSSDLAWFYPAGDLAMQGGWGTGNCQFYGGLRHCHVGPQIKFHP
jgi:hypothetical protein